MVIKIVDTVLYVLPQWKESGHHGGLRFSVKQWNPDLVDGVVFNISSSDRSSAFKLIIGADGNEKILLYFKTELVKQKTMPHLIPSGRWVSFWLQVRRGEIVLGLEGNPSALFEWKASDEGLYFNPVFLSYGSMYGFPIGTFKKYRFVLHSYLLSTNVFDFNYATNCKYVPVPPNR